MSNHTTDILEEIIRTPAKLPEEKNDEAPAKPPMYIVLLHNDNTTLPTFVTRVLRDVFNCTDAYRIMLAAHNGGTATVHIVSKEVAETELANAEVMIRTAQPNVDFYRAAGSCELRFSMEQETKGD